MKFRLSRPLPAARRSGQGRSRRKTGLSLPVLDDALVTDGGGVLSHAAIVAREHGTPAVLGARTAAQEIRDGDLIEMDGTGGVVRRAGV